MNTEELFAIIDRKMLSVMYLLGKNSQSTNDGCIIGRRLIKPSHLYLNASEKKKFDSLVNDGLIEIIPGTRGVLLTLKGLTFLNVVLRTFDGAENILRDSSVSVFEAGMEKLRKINEYHKEHYITRIELKRKEE